MTGIGKKKISLKMLVLDNTLQEEEEKITWGRYRSSWHQRQRIKTTLTAAEELRPELSRPSEPHMYPVMPCGVLEVILC